MKIKVQTNQGAFDAELIKNNRKTWIVDLPDGNRVKRHKIKHAVQRAEPRRD